MAEERQPTSFEDAGHEQQSFLAEYWEFLVTNKKWWLIPIVSVLFLVGALVVLSSSTAGVFLYPFF